MRILLSTAVAAALIAAPAHAETYGKLFGGVGLGVDHDIEGEILGVDTGAGELRTDLGYDVGGAIGYQLTDFFGVEGEVAYRSNSVDGGIIDGVGFDGDGDLTSLSFMGNGVFTAPSGYGFTPYVGAGIGTARIGGEGDHDYTFAYQGFAGVKRQLTERVSAGVEYRYFAADEANFANDLGSLSADYSAHNMNFVLTSSF